VAWRQTPSAGVLRADGVVVPSIMVPPGSEAKPGHRSATVGTQPSKILDPEQREGCRFKGQPRQVYEPLGDSRRGCNLLAGQREYALRFWPASFHTALEYARNTSTKCVNLSEGARQSAGSFIVWQSKSDLAQSAEAGEGVSIHDCGTWYATVL